MKTFKYFSKAKVFVRVVIATIEIYWLKSVIVNKKILSKFGFSDADRKKKVRAIN